MNKYRSCSLLIMNVMLTRVQKKNDFFASNSKSSVLSFSEIRLLF
jgi:hypothetical protein